VRVQHARPSGCRPTGRRRPRSALVVSGHARREYVNSSGRRKRGRSRRSQLPHLLVEPTRSSSTLRARERPRFSEASRDYIFRIDRATNSYVDEWGTTPHAPGRVFLRHDRHSAGEAETEADLTKYRWPKTQRTRPRIAGPAGEDSGGLPSRERIVMMAGPCPPLGALPGTCSG